MVFIAKITFFLRHLVPNKPKENASFPLIQQLMVTVENTQRQIAVTLLPKTVLCGDTNGKPNLWGVIVSSDDQAASTGNTFNINQHDRDVLYFVLILG